MHAVYVVEVCDNDEYGTMVLHGLFETKEAALRCIKEDGLQTEDEGESWNWREDYATVTLWEVHK